MFIRNLPGRGYLYFAGGLNLAAALVVAISIRNLPPVVPLYYGLPVGTGQLISSWALLIAPATALLISVINAGIAYYLKDHFLKKILVAASFFISLLSTTTIIRIILLVGFW